MQLIDALFDLCSQSRHPIIAIDGPAGAGKTTLAEHLVAALSLKYKCTTIHMDNLYHGWSTPFDSHFTDALIGLTESHRAGTPLSLSKYDWRNGRYLEAEKIPASNLLILEGVASTHHLIRASITAAIWIEIEPKIGLERVLSRDGQSISQEMDQWLELQEQHFAAEESEKGADFVLSN
jgi:uridine kinase